MSKLITASNPKGVEIRFEEQAHVYETNNCKDFTSVTTFIHNFFTPFDRENISKRFAKKHNMTQEEVLAKWDLKRDLACELGTNVHLRCELALKQEKLNEPLNEKEERYFKIADQAVEKLLTKYDLVETEKIIFSEDNKLAGTVDIIMRNKNTDKLFILDWKTNEKITYKNYYGQYGLDPIKHLDDANYIHYSLQLNLYKKLLLQEGYFDEDNIKLAIIHLSDKPTWIQIGDFSEEINNMLFKTKWI